MNNNYDDISEEEKYRISSLIAQGHLNVPPNNFKCSVCGSLLHLPESPKKYSIIECNNCKTAFFITLIYDDNNNSEQGQIDCRRIPDKNKTKVLEMFKKFKEEIKNDS